MDLINNTYISAAEINRANHADNLSEQILAQFEHVWDRISDTFLGTNRVEAKALVKVFYIAQHGSGPLMEHKDELLKETQLAQSADKINNRVDLLLSCYERLDALLEEPDSGYQTELSYNHRKGEISFRPYSSNRDEIVVPILISSPAQLGRHSEFTLNNLDELGASQGKFGLNRHCDALAQIANALKFKVEHVDLSLSDEAYRQFKVDTFTPLFSLFSNQGALDIKGLNNAIKDVNTFIQPQLHLTLEQEQHKDEKSNIQVNVNVLALYEYDAETLQAAKERSGVDELEDLPGRFGNVTYEALKAQQSPKHLDCLCLTV
ncbi:hypothetical protein [uncultured Shewanella sp.]|uniref:hypothetical protein n=1 Tax=uncultured Shewanella sp. TaxID=173975 RepID=UPI002629B3AF|nr:hypothetical protein [uncultured Shewanella sp.]